MDEHKPRWEMRTDQVDPFPLYSIYERGCDDELICNVVRDDAKYIVRRLNEADAQLTSQLTASRAQLKAAQAEVTALGFAHDKLMEDNKRLRGLLKPLAKYNDAVMGYGFCDFCGRDDGHDADCPVLHARAVLSQDPEPDQKELPL
jgi:inorganic pyrophosphatase